MMVGRHQQQAPGDKQYSRWSLLDTRLQKMKLVAARMPMGAMHSSELRRREDQRRREGATIENRREQVPGGSR